jgi:hypothetical protein
MTRHGRIGRIPGAETASPDIGLQLVVFFQQILRGSVHVGPAAIEKRGLIRQKLYAPKLP